MSDDAIFALAALMFVSIICAWGCGYWRGQSTAQSEEIARLNSLLRIFSDEPDDEVEHHE